MNPRSAMNKPSTKAAATAWVQKNGSPTTNSLSIVTHPVGLFTRNKINTIETLTTKSDPRNITKPLDWEMNEGTVATTQTGSTCTYRGCSVAIVVKHPTVHPAALFFDLQTRVCSMGRKNQNIWTCLGILGSKIDQKKQRQHH